ncbi:hypothetical protein [Dyella solisilvae]|uniref:hypothetical protein n=1 Tax=Dyella solisilvae TaxID=1920168 RepID=UPI0011C01B53|nr:hypothetical protein [Dyella solisilvae]
MAIGVIGVDSDAGIHYPDILTTAKRSALPRIVRFWGRYFKGPNSVGGPQYSGDAEGRLFQKENILLMPLARQTNAVGGSRTLGSSLAKGNVDAFFQEVDVEHAVSASIAKELLFFLDVEPGTDLSEDFYLGWSETLSSEASRVTKGRIGFVPGVYLNRCNNKESVAVLNKIRNEGGYCAGLMVASYRTTDNPEEPVDWTTAHVSPSMATDIPILAWQYAADRPPNKHLDYVQVNPDAKIQEYLLSRLIVPA